MRYNRLQTLRTINSNHHLAKVYLEAIENSMAVDTAIRYMFDEYIITSPVTLSLYFEKEVYDRRLNYEPVVEDILALIEEHGWKKFAFGLKELALNKKQTLEQLGLPEASERWERIAKKFDSLPTKVQL